MTGGLSCKGNYVHIVNGILYGGRAGTVPCLDRRRANYCIFGNKERAQSEEKGLTQPGKGI